MAQQKSVLRESLKKKIVDTAKNHASDIGLWRSLLQQSVELDFFEQMFQIVRMHGQTIAIYTLRKVILADYEHYAVEGDELANRIVLSFARTMSDVRLLSRFWSHEITIPKMVMRAEDVPESDRESFSDEPISRRQHRLLPDLSSK